MWALRRKKKYCLRCKTVLLDVLQSPPSITFYECPECHRNFAQKPGKSLCFRWLHPVSLALYPVIFEISPNKKALDAAISLAKQKSEEAFKLIIEEIKLELDEPTQQVGDILDCRASEEELRSYLRLVLEHMQQVGPLTPQRLKQMRAPTRRHPRLPKLGPDGKKVV